MNIEPISSFYRKSSTATDCELPAVRTCVFTQDFLFAVSRKAVLKAQKKNQQPRRVRMTASKHRTPHSADPLRKSLADAELLLISLSDVDALLRGDEGATSGMAMIQQNASCLTAALWYCIK